MHNICYYLQTAGILLFILILERFNKFIVKRLFSVIYIVLIGVLTFYFIFAIEYTQTVSFMFYPAFVIFFLVYVKVGVVELYKKSAIGSYNKQILVFITGFFTAAIGFAFAADAAANLFGREIRILGDIFELVGFFLVFTFFISVPTFSEYDWQGKIEFLYLSHKSGVFIYSKEFRNTSKEEKKQIISGNLTAVKLLLQKLTDTLGVSVIEQEGKVVIINPGKELTAILVCDEN